VPSKGRPTAKRPARGGQQGRRTSSSRRPTADELRSTARREARQAFRANAAAQLTRWSPGWARCAAVWVLGTAALAGAYHRFYDAMQLDSAYAREMLDSIGSHLAPQTHVTASFLVALPWFTEHASDVCAADLHGGGIEPINVLTRHAYLVLYLLTPLRVLLGSDVLLPLILGASFAGMAVGAYVFPRRRGVGRWTALAFTGLVIASPAWSLAVEGQYYYDRLFLGAGLWFLFLLHERFAGVAHPTWLLVVVGVLAASVNERASLMVGLMCLPYLASRWPADAVERRLRLVVSVLAVVTLAWALVYVTFLTVNTDYGSFSAQARHFVDNVIHDETFRRNVEKFLLANSPLLLLSLASGRRLAALAYLSIVPNLIGSIGGAEKTGWYTHYHSYYFPVIAGTAAVGLVRLYAAHPDARRRIALVVANVGLATATACLFASPSPSVLDFDVANLKAHGVVFAAGAYVEAGPGWDRRMVADAHKQLGDAVPDDARVTTVESAMPSLYRPSRVLDYYPVGVDDADYAVLPFSLTPTGERRYTGTTSYLGETERTATDDCMQSRLVRAGFDTEPIAVVNGYAVLRRSGGGQAG
jgi:hypothetical protein